MPSKSSRHPTPVLAEPKNTGVICRAATARFRLSCSFGRGGCSSFKTASSISGSKSASSSKRFSWKEESSQSGPDTAASISPSPRTDCMGKNRLPGNSRVSWERTFLQPLPARSILFKKMMPGRFKVSMAFQMSLVWACTPSTADNSRTAPSKAPRLRSTSPEKSAWPGVSMRFTAVSPKVSREDAARTEMPRRRSTSSQSVWAVPSSTLPALRMAPARYKSCSVRVVFPASAWASRPAQINFAPFFSSCPSIKTPPFVISFSV